MPGRAPKPPRFGLMILRSNRASAKTEKRNFCPSIVPAVQILRLIPFVALHRKTSYTGPHSTSATEGVAMNPAYLVRNTQTVSSPALLF